MNKEQMNKYAYELMVKNNPEEAVKNLLLKDKQIETYKSRNEKAVEYVKSKKAIIDTDYIRIFDLFKIDEQGYTDKLLNILNGGENNE